MSFVLQPHEVVLFKHRSKHANQDGSLFVTSLRLAWQPAAGISVSDIVLSWSAIESVKYSSPQDAKCLIRLALTDKAVKPLIFALMPSTAASDTCRSELERLKLVIRDVRSGVSAPPPPSSSSAAPSILGKRKTANTTHDEDSYRAQLLASDAQLNMQYKELVEGGIIDENDFWENKQQLLSNAMGSSLATNKAIPSTLLADISGSSSSSSSNGNVKHVTLTAETIHAIFLLYPAVAKVYQLKVPHEWSEQEFWTKYLQSNYYQSDKGGGLSSSSGIAADSFTQEALKHTDGKRRAFQQIAAESKKHLVAPEVDLRRQEFDYHAPIRYEPDDLRLAEPSAIVHKYNRNSAIVMQNSGCVTDSSHITSTEPMLPELMKEPPPPYVELQMTNTSKHSKQRSTMAAVAPNASPITASFVLSSLTSINPTTPEAAVLLHSDIQQLKQHSFGTRSVAAAAISGSTAASIAAAMVDRLPAPQGFQEVMSLQKCYFHES